MPKHNTRPIDDLVWIEGKYPESNEGLPLWVGLYCYHEKDICKAQAILNRINKSRLLGIKLNEGLDIFEAFRIKMPGEISDALDILNDIRNTFGGWALTKLMTLYFPACGKINQTTGELCQLQPNHLLKGQKHTGRIQC
jgi:hypothetical protein